MFIQLARACKYLIVTCLSFLRVIRSFTLHLKSHQLPNHRYKNLSTAYTISSSLELRLHLLFLNAFVRNLITTVAHCLGS